MAVREGPVKRLEAQRFCAVRAIHAYMTQKTPMRLQRMGVGKRRDEARRRRTAKTSQRCAMTAAMTMAMRFQNMSRSTMGPSSAPSGGIHATCGAICSRMRAKSISEPAGGVGSHQFDEMLVDAAVGGQLGVEGCGEKVVLLDQDREAVALG